MSKTSRPVRVGNMRQTSSYNPFPKDGGLVSQYERFMRKRVRHFYETYPHVSYDDLLSEAVRLAVHAATLFKPELGNDFSTYLGPHLMGLHRFAQSQTMQLPQPKDEPSREEIGEPVRPVEFVGGANGARLTLDRQWLSGTIKGEFARFKRHRIILGVQLPSADEDHARGVHRRISEDLDAVLAACDRESVRPGFLRFIVDNAESRQREIEQEAENRKYGDYTPVFLTPTRLNVDFAVYKGRKPPSFFDRYVGFVSLDSHAGHDEDGWKMSQHETIASGSPSPTESEACQRDMQRFWGAITEERPFLKRSELSVLDWRLNPADRRTGKQVARDIGMTPGAVSKIGARIEERVQRRLKK